VEVEMQTHSVLHDILILLNSKSNLKMSA